MHNSISSLYKNISSFNQVLQRYSPSSEVHENLLLKQGKLVTVVIKNFQLQESVARSYTTLLSVIHAIVAEVQYFQKWRYNKTNHNLRLPV